MDHSRDILNELNTLSPLLATVPRVNVFTVPNGYFDYLSTSILLSINEPQMDFLVNTSKEHQPSVPEGYFESLADTIMAKIKMAEFETADGEIKRLSPALAATGNDN